MKLPLTLNISTTLMTRLTEAVEQLASDYHRVHSDLLDKPPPSTEKGRVFYQSDKQYFEDELKAKEKGVEVV